jgi:hypothetical protein
MRIVPEGRIVSLLFELVYSLDFGGVVKDALAVSASDLLFLRAPHAFDRSFDYH